MAALPDDSYDWGAPVPPPMPSSHGVVGGIRCPFCKGNCWSDGESVRCMMCARALRLTKGPQPQALGSAAPSRRSCRVGDGEEQRVARSISRSQGETGLKARLLQSIPEEPSYTTAWALGRPIRTSTEEVRSLLRELIDLGLVREVRYQAGCVRPKNKPLAVGYQRPRVEVSS